MSQSTPVRQEFNTSRTGPLKQCCCFKPALRWAGDSSALMIVWVLRIQISLTGPRPASCGNRRWLAVSGFSTTR